MATIVVSYGDLTAPVPIITVSVSYAAGNLPANNNANVLVSYASITVPPNPGQIGGSRTGIATITGDTGLIEGPKIRISYADASLPSNTRINISYAALTTAFPVPTTLAFSYAALHLSGDNEYFLCPDGVWRAMAITSL